MFHTNILFLGLILLTAIMTVPETVLGDDTGQSSNCIRMDMTQKQDSQVLLQQELIQSSYLEDSYKVSDVFINLKEETSDSLCATLPQAIPQIVYDENFMWKLKWELVKELSLKMHEDFRKKFGPVQQVEIEIINGKIVISSLGFTNFSLEKAPGTNYFSGQTWSRQEIKIQCN